MAYEGNLQIAPGLTAGADLSSKQYYFAKVSSGGVIGCNTQGEAVDGVIQDKPDASGKAVSVAYSGISKVVAGAAILKGALVQTDANGKAMTAAAAPTSATKDSSAGPFDMAAGDTMVVDVDNVGNATATFDAAAGYAIDTTSYPVADQDGLTEKVTIDGGDEQTVTFSGAHTLAAQIAASLNAQLVGASATSSDPTSATKTTNTGAPWNMAPGDTMVIDVDNVGNATATWDAAQGTVTDTTGYPVADQDTKTEKVTIDGGDEQTVTFAGVTTTAASIASQMNEQLVGCQVTVAGGQVKILSDTYGTDSSVAIGTGTTAMTWDAPVAGTGDVANIDAVTEAEVKTVIEADTTAEVVANGDGSVTLNSPTTGVASELDFKSGNAIAILGLSVEVVIGTAGGQVKITSDKKGTGSSVAIGTGTCALTWNAPVAGTGDVVDIDAVTATEVKTVVEADTTANVAVNADGSFTITSPTTGATSELDFKSGNVLAACGLSVEVVTGEESGTHYSGRALEAASNNGDIISVLLMDGLN